MRTSRFTENQIVGILKEHARLEDHKKLALA